MGYYFGPEQTLYPVSVVDWAALTHVAVAFTLPHADGSLDDSLSLGATGGPQLANTIVSAAHAHGVRAVASIGGAQSGPVFEQATAAGVLPTFVANLVALVTQYGYDGLDLDWEPLLPADRAAAVALASQLKSARASLFLSIPVAFQNGNHPGDLSGFGAIAAAYDQVNVMTYHMAGAYAGWKSWHTSALHYADSATPSSIDDSVGQYLAAGVPASKLGFGIAGYGLCYTQPVSGPDQALGGATILDTGMGYADIVTSYYSPNARTWDPLALAPYLTFAAPTGPDGCTYVTYDDAQSIAAKGAYLKSHGLGGVILWTINRGYVGSTNPLLEAVRKNVLD
jgi:chitinase